MAEAFAFYGLRYNPFEKENVTPKNAFQSEDFKAVQGRMRSLSESRGIGVITAPSGDGKTLAVRCAMEGLNPNLFVTGYIPLSTVTVGEFYRQWCDLLGVEKKGGKPGMLRNMKEQMRAMYKVKHQPLFLVLDEAQCLSTAILNDLKIILNFDYDSLNCVCLVLCGEPHFNNTLLKPVHESLLQRVTVHYNFRGLRDGEVADYVRHKITSAGGPTSILTDSALGAVHGHSHGTPRIIDNLMRDALIIGAQNDKQAIDSEVILAAVENRNLG